MRTKSEYRSAAGGTDNDWTYDAKGQTVGLRSSGSTLLFTVLQRFTYTYNAFRQITTMLQG